MYRRALVLFVISLFILMVSIHTVWEYMGGARPFTKGFYTKALAGRVTSLSLYKDQVTIRLNTSDSSYFFLPDPDPLRSGSYFWRVVQRGDSLWKAPVSDTVYTMSNGLLYTWPFPTKDKFGQSYLDEERHR